MPARVFISCGQVTAEERQVATIIKEWFARRGFEPYVAIQAQSLADINSGIIGELKQSDFYVFIDFHRERLVSAGGFINPFKRYPHRGSLFTNQELAVAFLLQFDNAIFLQQEGIEHEGLLRYMGSNAQRFATLQDVPALVEQLVVARHWDPSYTRHLSLGATHWAGPLMYGDHTGQHSVRVFEVDVHNRRHELGALNAIARLRQIVSPDRSVNSAIDRSPLKTTGQPGYTQVIWPQSHAAWDLFAVRMDAPPAIYLNSALDVAPRSPLISLPGEYVLTYEIFAENFPVLRFDVRLSVSNDPLTTSAILTESAVV